MYLHPVLGLWPPFHSVGYLLPSQTPCCAHKQKKHHKELFIQPQPSIVADYLDKNTSAAIGGDDNGGGSRRGTPRRLASLSHGQPVVPLSGDNKEEAINAAAIDYTASLSFHDNNNDSDDGNGDDDKGVRAGGGGPHGTNKEEQEEEMGEAGEEGWERLSKKRKSEMNEDELFAHFEAQLRGGLNAPIRHATALQSWMMQMPVLQL
jgi:hypothetical protein